MKLDWRLVAAVAVGGAIGSVARFMLTALIQHRVPSQFPIATLGINVAGSFLLGYLLQLSLGPTSMSPEVRVLLTTGFCGGFTTFSSFSYETIRLADGGGVSSAGLYVAASVLLSLGATVLGIRIAHV